MPLLSPLRTDKDEAKLSEQAYRLTLSSDQITITGNTETGLFYGIHTFIQLLKEQSGKAVDARSQGEDWPDMELSAIYWDDAHHLEHLDELNAAIQRASFTRSMGLPLSSQAIFITSMLSLLSILMH